MGKNGAKSEDQKTPLESGGKAANRLTKKMVEKQYKKGSVEARENGRKGGIKSGESKRNKREARDSIRYLLELSAKKNLETNLTELGFPTEELTNMNALHARLFTMAMSGNLEAYLTLMKMGGYEPEENRKERESIASDARREKELEAKVNALGGDLDGAKVAVNLQDEDDNNDVVIYMPKMDTEDSCEVEVEDENAAENPEGNPG